jgi:predicted N-acetyltransferase YhbS
MDIVIRPGTPDDAKKCGEIFYRAFVDIAEQHNFPPDVTAPDPSPDSAWTKRFSHPNYFVVVAEIDGQIVGSNMLDERDPIAGVGPITVDPAVQQKSVGRLLMQAVLERAAKQKYPGVRLVQAAYNRQSLSLYTKLGFDVREFLVSMLGPPINLPIPGFTVRQATASDLEGCNALCRRVHGHQRSGALMDGIEKGSASIVERDGRLTGYSSVIGTGGHAVGETTDDLKALISSVEEFSDPAGFILPARNSEMFRWCLENNLRIALPMTLMTMGMYQEPSGAFLPSIFY